MTLSDYKERQRMTLAQMAELLGISLGYASDLVNGKSGCSLELAVRIEEATGGKVRCRDLLPEAAA